MYNSNKTWRKKYKNCPKKYNLMPSLRQEFYCQRAVMQVEDILGKNELLMLDVFTV